MDEAEVWTEWNLTGLQVTQLWFDYRFHVHFWALDRDLLLVFGTPFTYRPGTGKSVILDPEQNETLAALLSLLHKPVHSFSASSRGQCVLRLSDERRSCDRKPIQNTSRGNRTGQASWNRHRYSAPSVPVLRGGKGLHLARNAAQPAHEVDTGPGIVLRMRKGWRTGPAPLMLFVMRLAYVGHYSVPSAG